MCVAQVGCECQAGWAGVYCGNEVPIPASPKGNGGAIAGGVIGALAGVALAGAIFYYRFVWLMLLHMHMPVACVAECTCR